MKIFCKLACVVILVGVLFAVSAMPVSADPSGWVLWEWHWQIDPCPFENYCDENNILHIPAGEFDNYFISPALVCSYGSIMLTGFSYTDNPGVITVTVESGSAFVFKFAETGYQVHNGGLFEYVQIINQDPISDVEITDVVITCMAAPDRVNKVVTYGEGGIALSNLFTAGILLLSIVIRLGERFLGK